MLFVECAKSQSLHVDPGILQSSLSANQGAKQRKGGQPKSELATPTGAVALCRGTSEYGNK